MIYSFGVNDVAEPGSNVSLHELSLLGALRFLPKHLIPRITILGIEPEAIDYGLDLSPTLQATMPTLIQRANKMVVDWRRVPSVSAQSGTI